MSDPINPDHYKAGGIETIDIIRAKLSPEQFEGFLLGNIIKYVTRAGKKGNGVEDLRKAGWYLDGLIGAYGLGEKVDCSQPPDGYDTYGDGHGYGWRALDGCKNYRSIWTEADAIADAWLHYDARPKAGGQ